MPAAVSDFCLRFADEAASFSVALQLDAVGETEDGPRLVRFSHRYALDVIGQIVLPPADPGAEPETLPGWHVNLRVLDGSELPPELAPFVVYPANPARVWA